jgi:phosphate-selective porin OprO/OprP
MRAQRRAPNYPAHPLRPIAILVKHGTQVLVALCVLAAPPAAAQEAGVFFDRRPTFVFGEGSRVELKARMQSDYLVRDESDPEAATRPFDERLSWQRKRVGIEGVLFNRVEFQVEGEVGDDHPWRDVYADVKIHRAVRVRAGRFKVPFSHEQLTSGTDRDFIARTAAGRGLSPGRDVGVMLHGRLADKAIQYEAGVFEVDAAARLWTAGAGRTLAGRITIAPLKDRKTRGSDALELSAALLRSDLPEARGGVSGRLVMGETFFPRVFVNGTRTRMGTSVAWNGLHASLTGEFMRSLDTRRGQAVDGGDLSDLVSTGGYIAGVWHVTARDGRRWRSAPLRGLDLTARFDRLTFGSTSSDPEAFLNPRADRLAPLGKDAWTAGVNWYVNRWVKVQANTVREQLADPLGLLPFGTTPLWSTVLRFQVAM